MAYVAAQCPNCGGDLQLDEKMEKGFCMHCGSKIKVQEAIQNVKIEGEVEISGIVGVEKLIENGKTFVRLEDYKRAEKIYKHLINIAPHRYEGWLGILVVESKNYSIYDKSLIKHFDKVLMLAKGNDYKQIEEIKVKYTKEIEQMEYQEQKNEHVFLLRKLENDKSEYNTIINNDEYDRSDSGNLFWLLISIIFTVIVGILFAVFIMGRIEELFIKWGIIKGLFIICFTGFPLLCFIFSIRHYFLELKDDPKRIKEVQNREKSKIITEINKINNQIYSTKKEIKRLDSCIERTDPYEVAQSDLFKIEDYIKEIESFKKNNKKKITEYYKQRLKKIKFGEEAGGGGILAIVGAIIFTGIIYVLKDLTGIFPNFFREVIAFLSSAFRIILILDAVLVIICIVFNIVRSTQLKKKMKIAKQRDASIKNWKKAFKEIEKTYAINDKFDIKLGLNNPENLIMEERVNLESMILRLSALELENFMK